MLVEEMLPSLSVLGMLSSFLVMDFLLNHFLMPFSVTCMSMHKMCRLFGCATLTFILPLMIKSIETIGGSGGRHHQSNTLYYHLQKMLFNPCLFSDHQGNILKSEVHSRSSHRHHVKLFVTGYNKDIKSR